jgi:hypothetical protein
MNRVIRRHPNALIADQRSDIKISARDLSGSSMLKDGPQQYADEFNVWVLLLVCGRPPGKSESRCERS